MHTAYFDASTKHDTRTTRIGYVIYSPEGKVKRKCSKPVQYMESNDAEWFALIELLKECKKYKIKYIKVYGDNKSVIDMATSGMLNKRLYQRRVRDLKMLFNICSFEWIEREDNKIADWLSKGRKLDSRKIKQHSRKPKESIDKMLCGISTRCKDQLGLKGYRAARREKKLMWR